MFFLTNSIEHTEVSGTAVHTELTEVPGTGVEFAPNHTGVLGRVLGPCSTNIRTLGIAVEGIVVPGVPVSNSCRTY